MATFDYTEAPEPRAFDLIPAGTVATVTMKLRGGGAGEDGLLKRSADGKCEMLDVEFTVTDGPCARRKFWTNFVLSGVTAGHATAADISKGTLRGIIESARGVRADDKSDAARAARTVSLREFDNMSFVAKIGVKKGELKPNGGGSYADKNVLIEAIGPDRRDWHAVEQSPCPPTNGSGGFSATASPPSSPSSIDKPSWAT